MPEFIVTQTAKEYSDYQKAKLAEANRIGWLWFIAITIGLSGVCWWLQP